MKRLLKTRRVVFDEQAFGAPVYDRSLLVPGDDRLDDFLSA